MARLPKRRFLAGKPTNTMRTVSDMMLSIAVDVQSWLFNADRVATGETINSIAIDTFKTSITMSAKDSIVWALGGRGPGKAPPPRNIIEWIKAKPIQFVDITIESLAFLIGRKIAREGTDKPHFTGTDLDQIIDQQYKRFSPRIAESIERETLKALDQIFLKNDINVKK